MAAHNALRAQAVLGTLVAMAMGMAFCLSLAGIFSGMASAALVHIGAYAGNLAGASVSVAAMAAQQGIA